MQNASQALQLMGTEGAIDLPHPQEADIRRQRQERIARRQAAATLAEEVTGGRDELTRDGPRQVGGTFRELQDVPDRQPRQQVGIGEEDLQSFLRSFQFAAHEEIHKAPDKVLKEQTQTFLKGMGVFG